MSTTLMEKHTKDEPSTGQVVSDTTTTATATTTATEQVVNPWQVNAPGGVDYDKLVDQFGCELLTPEIVARIGRLTGREPHVWLRRNFFYSHRCIRVLFFFSFFFFFFCKAIMQCLIGFPISFLFLCVCVVVLFCLCQHSTDQCFFFVVFDDFL